MKQSRGTRLFCFFASNQLYLEVGKLEKLLKLCMGAVEDMFLALAVERVDTADPDVRELLFRKLVALFYGASAMIAHLGYTPEDTQRAIAQIKPNQPQSNSGSENQGGPQ